MITSFYPPFNFGGDGVFVRHLSNELARRGHGVEIIHCLDAYRLASSPPREEYRDHPNVKVHGLKSRWGALSPLATHQTGLPLLKTRRISEILESGFDVIHYHNISLVGGPGILALGAAIKLYTMHDFWLVCPTHGLFRFNRAPCPRPTLCFTCVLVHKRPPQWWRYLGALERYLHHVDAFIAPSLTSQRKHEQMGFSHPIVHLPNFISASGDGSSSTEHRASQSDRPYFLFVGRLEKLKGLHTLIPAFRLRPNIELWIAGTGSEERSLRDAARECANVRFLGHQSSERLESLYRDAVALIYPSANFQLGIAHESVRGGQGAPLVVIEAFSQKTPVIASRVGGLPALLERLGAGLAYSTEQELLAALDRLLDDPAYRRDLGAGGHGAYLQHWTPDAHIDRYLALIEQIAGEKAKRGG